MDENDKINKKEFIMKLNKNIVPKEINSLENWFFLAPPMGGMTQWKDGRSAKELARYITGSLPQMPKEVEQVLSCFSKPDAAFDWSAEHVTDFAHFGYGRGMGRNHDAVVYNRDVFMGIEAKADEPFGDKTIQDEMKNAGDNKLLRIRKLVELVFGDEPENHLDLRYQLLTACGGVLLEAKKREVKNAVLLVLVFLKAGTDAEGNAYYTEENRQRNNEDWRCFLEQIKAEITPQGCYKVPTQGACCGINMYVQKIEIPIP